MSSQVTVAHVNSYTNMGALLLQQGASKLYSKITKRPASGVAAKIVEQFGEVQAREKTTRHGDVEYTNTPHAGRWVHPKRKYVADLIDNEDRLKALIELQPWYVQSQMAALGRDLDGEIITAAFGTAYTGQAGTTSEAWSATYEVAAGSTGLTLDKIRDGARLMMSADWDPTMGDQGYLVVSSQQMDDLWGITQVTSKDFNGGRAVVENGEVKSLFGFEVLRVSDAILPVASSVRDVMMFAKSGIALGEWQGMQTKVDTLPSKFHSTQVISDMIIGATRTELGKVVKIKCNE
jgi:hypothetical protein